jgi:hypothetical protein
MSPEAFWHVQTEVVLVSWRALASYVELQSSSRRKVKGVTCGAGQVELREKSQDQKQPIDRSAQEIWVELVTLGHGKSDNAYICSNVSACSGGITASTTALSCSTFRDLTPMSVAKSLMTRTGAAAEFAEVSKSLSPDWSWAVKGADS